MDREEYRRLRDMITDALETNRPIERNISGKWTPLDVLGVSVAQLRVQPAPPQPKFRPMNDDELEHETRCGTIVEAEGALSGAKVVGPLVMHKGAFFICDRSISRLSLRFANPTDPRYGQPLQVEIKDDPQ